MRLDRAVPFGVVLFAAMAWGEAAFAQDGKAFGGTPSFEAQQLKNIWNSPGLAGTPASGDSAPAAGAGGLKIPGMNLHPREPGTPGAAPCANCQGGYRSPSGSKECTASKDDPSVPSNLVAWLKNNSAVIRAVAIVEIGQKRATAFLAAPGWVATNRHVAQELIAAGGVGHSKATTDRGARLHFGSSDDGRKPFRTVDVPKNADVYLDDDADLALIKVDVGTGIEPLRLAADAPSPWGGKNPPLTLVMVGYSAAEKASLTSDPDWFSSMYMLCGDTERTSHLQVQAGRQLTRSFTDTKDDLPYTFNTFGGSSGSPVFMINSDQVVGIHREEGLVVTAPNVGISVSALNGLINKVKKTPGG